MVIVILQIGIIVSLDIGIIGIQIGITLILDIGIIMILDIGRSPCPPPADPMTTI